MAVPTTNGTTPGVDFNVSGNRAWLWDGTVWVPYAGPAIISGTTGSPATNTYSSGGINYSSWAWTSTGSVTVSFPGWADVLLVGGGGGSGGGSGSSHNGGGGGQMVPLRIWLPAGTHTVQIGAGGASSSEGGLSYIGTVISAIGGGRGGFDYPAGRHQGGSAGSGGGSSNSQTGGTALDSRYGNNGGSAGSNPSGGGAGSAASGGTPGTGLANNYRTGSNVTYAAGGQGGTSAGSPGAANTGNGGGQSAGAGGSGLIVIRNWS